MSKDIRWSHQLWGITVSPSRFDMVPETHIHWMYYTKKFLAQLSWVKAINLQQQIGYKIIRADPTVEAMAFGEAPHKTPGTCYLIIVGGYDLGSVESAIYQTKPPGIRIWLIEGIRSYERAKHDVQ